MEMTATAAAANMKPIEMIIITPERLGGAGRTPSPGRRQAGTNELVERLVLPPACLGTCLASSPSVEEASANQAACRRSSGSSGWVGAFMLWRASTAALGPFIPTGISVTASFPPVHGLRGVPCTRSPCTGRGAWGEHHAKSRNAADDLHLAAAARARRLGGLVFPHLKRGNETMPYDEARQGILNSLPGINRPNANRLILRPGRPHRGWGAPVGSRSLHYPPSNLVMRRPVSSSGSPVGTCKNLLDFVR